MPGITDRDHFAAAALTGLLSQCAAEDREAAETAAAAMRYADAMLRERCRVGGDCPVPDNAPNHDAAPAARGDARECTAPVTTGGTQWLNYNANDYVRVKLTAHGRELLKKQHESLNAMTAYLRYLPPFEDADGWSKWQLHRLMSTFGAHTGMGIPLCFEPTIQFDSARANHDAAPAARASEATASPERVRVRGDAGTGDTQSFDAYARFAGTVMDWISEATSAYAASCRSDGGRKIMAEACSQCWDAFDRIAYPTIHGASPEARASVESVAPQPTAHGDSDRTDKAAPRPSEGTGDTPAPHATHGECSVPREGTQEPVAWRGVPVAWAAVAKNGQPLWLSYDRSGAEGMVNGMAEVVPLYRQAPDFAPPPPDNAEPVAWAALRDDGDIAWIGYTPDGAADGACGRQIVPLYRSPTLTDAEREALETATAGGVGHVYARRAAALRGLLERLGGGK